MEEAEKHRNRAVFLLPGPLAARMQPEQGVLHCKERFRGKVSDSLFWQMSAEPDFRYTICFCARGFEKGSRRSQKVSMDIH